MSALDTAPQRSRPLEEIGKNHQRAICKELAAWGYVYTGMDKASGAIMAHPKAGVVKVHASPTSKSGQRKSCLDTARKQLAAIGVTVRLPWHPQPKTKEKPMAAVEQQPRTTWTRPELRSEIRKYLATTGERRVTARDIAAALDQDRIPRGSGDSKNVPLAVSQALNTLVEQGVLTAVRDESYRPEGAKVGPAPKGYRLVRAAVTPIGGVEPVTAVPADGVEIEPGRDITIKAGTKHSVRDGWQDMSDDEVDKILAAGGQFITGEVVTTDGIEVYKDETTPAPTPDVETPEAPTPAPEPSSGLPAELVEQMRAYLVGDLDTENELLREGLQAAVAKSKALTADLEDILAAIGERKPVAKPAVKRERVARPEIVGQMVRTRLVDIVNAVTDADKLGQSLHYTTIAGMTGLGATLVSNALSQCVRLNHRPAGHRVTHPARGRYIIH